MATASTQVQAASEVSVRDDRYDEVWDGVLMMSPIANTVHQVIQSRLIMAFGAVIDGPGLGSVCAGLNVSDRGEGWLHNYRIPDVCVYLNGNPAIDHGPHIEGGPDLAVEIVSDAEDAHAKLGFYAAVNTHELLIVDRENGWALELFRLVGSVLTLVGRVTPGGGSVTSEAVGFAFRPDAGDPRPAIVMTHAASGRVWRA